MKQKLKQSLDKCFEQTKNKFDIFFLLSTFYIYDCLPIVIDLILVCGEFCDSSKLN